MRLVDNFFVPTLAILIVETLKCSAVWNSIHIDIGFKLKFCVCFSNNFRLFLVIKFLSLKLPFTGLIALPHALSVSLSQECLLHKAGTGPICSNYIPIYLQHLVLPSEKQENFINDDFLHYYTHARTLSLTNTRTSAAIPRVLAHKFFN